MYQVQLYSTLRDTADRQNHKHTQPWFVGPNERVRNCYCVSMVDNFVDRSERHPRKKKNKQFLVKITAFCRRTDPWCSRLRFQGGEFSIGIVKMLFEFSRLQYVFLYSNEFVTCDSIPRACESCLARTVLFKTPFRRDNSGAGVWAGLWVYVPHIYTYPHFCCESRNLYSPFFVWILSWLLRFVHQGAPRIRMRLPGHRRGTLRWQHVYEVCRQ